MNDDFSFGRRAGWRRPGRRAEPPWPLPVLAGLGVALALIALSVARLRGPEPQAPAHTRKAATPQPVCAAPEISADDVQAALGRGQAQLAVALLEQELSRAICAEARPALERLLVATAIEAMLQSRTDPRDQAALRAEAERLPGLRELARRSGAPFPSPLDLGRAAYGRDQFLLSLAAFDLALREGSADPADPAFTQQYSSALYNQGYWWTRVRGPAYDAGLALLAASACVDWRYGGGGAAAALLAELLGPASPRPPPAPVVLLELGGPCAMS